MGLSRFADHRPLNEFIQSLGGDSSRFAKFSKPQLSTIHQTINLAARNPEEFPDLLDGQESVVEDSWSFVLVALVYCHLSSPVL